MKRRLFNIAWSIVDQFESFADALVHAWKVVKLQIELCVQSAVRFSYRKIDGSIREAVGTLQNVPETKGTDKKVNYGVLCYYDVIVGGWRSAKAENIIFN